MNIGAQSISQATHRDCKREKIDRLGDVKFKQKPPSAWQSPGKPDLSRLPPEQPAQKVDLMAERLERSKNRIIKQALSAWIDYEEERSRLTREALADIDAGRVIDR